MPPESRLLKQQTYYEYWYFEDAAGAVTMLLRHFTATVTRSGRLVVRRTREGRTFPGAAAMLEAIGDGRWRGLPARAWGDRDYVPPAFRRRRLLFELEREPVA